MNASAIVVIGASAGGVEALVNVVARLPSALPAAVCVALHMPPTSRTMLPQILGRAGPLPTAQAVDGELLHPGHIYIAPPDNHLNVEFGRVKVHHGMRENNHRPAIDQLFRSAARAYGARTVGVLLSGADDDGTEGLYLIKSHGGVALVQDPEEALFARMPASAVEHVAVDAALPVCELGERIAAAVQALPHLNSATPEPGPGGIAMLPNAQPPLDHARLDSEISAWNEGDPVRSASGLACPLCGGGIWQGNEGPLLRFRCHEGHAFSPDTFADTQAELLESTLWSAVRLLSERAVLFRRYAEHAQGRNQPQLRARYLEQASEIEQGLELLRGMLGRRGTRVGEAS